MKKNILNTIILLFLSVSVVLLIYTHYKSYFVFDNKRLSIYIIYYVIFSSGILFCSILFFLKDTFKENILVSLTTFIFIAYISESFFLFYKYKDLSDIQISEKRRLERAKIILEKYNIEVEKRSILEFQRDEKKKGNDLSLLITPYRMIQSEGIKNFSWKEGSDKPKRIYPLAGVSNKLTIGGAETGEYNVYLSDRYGFNNPDSEWDEKGHIILIGDSAVHAAYIPWEDGWAGNIKKLTNKPTLALGIGNNGPLLDLAILKEYAKKVKPKIIFWVYVEENDLVEVKEEIKSKILSQYLNKNFTQNLLENQSLIEENYNLFLNYKINEKENNNKSVGNAFSVDNKKDYNLISFIKLINLRQFLFNDAMQMIKGSITKKDLSNFKKILQEAKDTTKSFNSKFFFVYLPATTRYIDSYEYILKDNGYYRDEVLKIVKELEIPIIDLWELYFKDLNDPLSTLSFRMHSHYNKETIKKASEILVEFLNKHN
jgi:hypothetical protein